MAAIADVDLLNYIQMHKNLSLQGYIKLLKLCSFTKQDNLQRHTSHSKLITKNSISKKCEKKTIMPLTKKALFFYNCLYCSKYTINKKKSIDI